MRSRQELLEASGYADRPKDFEALIRILDNEVRLITPTDPEGVDPDDSNTKVETSQKYYQLTHDYLVHSLRDWLTRKQKETRRGRAELRLGRSSALWNAKPENRHSAITVGISQHSVADRQKEMDRPQRKMMGRRDACMAFAPPSLLPSLLHSSSLLCARVNTSKRKPLWINLSPPTSRSARHCAKAGWLPPLGRPIASAGRRTGQTRFEEETAFGFGAPARGSESSPIANDLPLVSPSQFPVVRDAMLPYKDSVAEPLWIVAFDPKRPIQQRFQAACALATYAPDDRTGTRSTPCGRHLVTLEASRSWHGGRLFVPPRDN